MNEQLSLNQICEYLNELGIKYSFVGDFNVCIKGYSALDQYQDDTITWIRGEGKAVEERITAAIVSSYCKCNVDNKIICENPKDIFYKILERFFTVTNDYYYDEDSIIHGNVAIDKSVVIGKGTIISGNVSIGANTQIGHNVVIRGNVEIGQNCIIKSGTIIGEDDIDFYYEDDGHRFLNKQFGGVEVQDDVIIGPNCVINRGAVGNTIICKNVTIDGLCNISHNVFIGKNTAIIAGTSLLGSVIIGNNCYLSTCTIRNGVTVGDNVTVGMGAVIVKNVDNNAVIYGERSKIKKYK